ncbi:hypothetical protein ASC62_20085 [Caulobacter sp. Root342]|nr:hypothetical protein ASC62_20085 [Caulobacter sp. Root342]
MGGVAEVGDVIAHAGRQGGRATILQLAGQFAFQHEDHVAAVAPVIGQVAGRIVDATQAHVADIQRAPLGLAGLSRMQRRDDGVPVDRREGAGGQLHQLRPLAGFGAAKALKP